MTSLCPFPKFRAFDHNGDPLAGGKLYAYVATTTTPQDTYTSSTGLVANANPVILDANGEADIWLNAAIYKFVLKSSLDVTQWTEDNIQGTIGAGDLINTATVTLGDALIGVKSPLSGGTARTQHLKNTDYVSVMDFGASTSGSDQSTIFQAALDAYDNVYVPPGTYIIDKPILITSGNKRLFGGGPASILKLKNGAGVANADYRMVYFTGAASATVENIAFDGNRANQSGTGATVFGGLLHAANTPRVMFNNVTAIDSYTDGIDIATALGQGYIQGCHIENCKLTGAKVSEVSYCRVVNNTFLNCQSSVQLASGSDTDLIISENTIIGDYSTISINGVLVIVSNIAGGLGTKQKVNISNNTIYGCLVSGGSGINFGSIEAAVSVAEFTIVGNVISGCDRGIIGTRSSFVTISSNVITNSSLEGISLGGCSNVSVLGNQIKEFTTAGLKLSTNIIAPSTVCNAISVSGNSFFNASVAVYGVDLDDTSQTKVVVTGNHFDVFTTPIHNAAYCYRISNNTGYVTENKGSGVILGGSTEVAAPIPHGLSYTPSVGEINITQGAVCGDYGTVWCYNIGATDFLVKCKADPTTDFNFGWSIRRV